MAIDDIVRRIAEDAANEAASLVAAAESDAARVRDDTTVRADAEAEGIVAREAALAARDAETVVANARLAARDAMLTARLEIDAQVLARAEQALIALPDAEYAALLARGIAAVMLGGESVLLGKADASRLRAALPAALRSAGAPAVAIAEKVAGIERGAVVEGDRVRAEVSPATMIAERREELLSLADRELFAEGD